MDIGVTGWPDCQDEFVLRPGDLHLNHGSFGAVPRAGLAAQQALRQEMESLPVVWFGQIAQRLDAARTTVAAFLQTQPEGLAFVTNPSAGASVIFNAGLVPAGRQIVVTSHGYGAVTGGAKRLARRIGGTVHTVDIPLRADAEEIISLLTPTLRARPGLLVIDQITSSTARMLPVAQVCELARSYGVLTLVDGAHAPGMLPHPVVGEADFWIGALHKWACAPRGSAVLVTARALREKLYPLIDSWSAERPYPWRFDIQGTCDQTPVMAAGATFDYLANTFGWDLLRAHNADLATWATDLVRDRMSALSDTDCTADVTDPAPSMRLVRLPGNAIVTNDHATAWRDHYAADGAQLAFSAYDSIGYLRLSAAAYNTPADYQRLADEVLPDLVHRLIAASASERNTP